MKSKTLLFAFVVCFAVACKKDHLSTDNKSLPLTEADASPSVLARAATCEGLRDPAAVTNISPTSLYQVGGSVSQRYLWGDNTADRIYWRHNADISGHGPYPISIVGGTEEKTILATNSIYGGTYSLVLQMDGNLVLYKNRNQPGQIALWALNTENQGYTIFNTLAGGAFGVAKVNGTKFTTPYFYLVGAIDDPCYCMTLQGDGNLVVYECGITIRNWPGIDLYDPCPVFVAWASDTEGDRISCHFGR